MTDEKIFGAGLFSDLDTYRLTLATLEAEKARVVAKYDARIAALQKVIEELKQPPAETAPVELPPPVEQSRPSRRTRKGSQAKPPA